MKFISRFIFVILLVSSIAASAGDATYTDYESAKKAASKKGLPILIEFSGSDWCGWCIRLHEEVISRKAFKKFAKDEVIFYIADFPSNKQLPAKQKKKNEELAAQYNVEGFPTVLLIDKYGKLIARTGYVAGGAEKYVEHLRTLIKTGKN
ncbi:hypothetical protein BVY04_01725 [bacterium M21]|nr:hypothetical protein BVY04_01725 [bacterium M21]